MLLTDEQVYELENRLEAYYKQFANGVRFDHVAANHIYFVEGRFEQCGFLVDADVVADQILEIVEDILGHGIDVDEYPSLYTDLIDFERKVSGYLPGAWYIFMENNNFYLARHWDKYSSIPEDLRPFVKDYKPSWAVTIDTVISVDALTRDEAIKKAAEEFIKLIQNEQAELVAELE